MANQIPRLFSRHICQPSAPFSKVSNSIPRALRAPLRNAPIRRTYATGESGPRPKPGKNTITIWPFVAITLAGSGAYALMVKSRAGTLQFFIKHSFVIYEASHFESRFKQSWGRTQNTKLSAALHHTASHFLNMLYLSFFSSLPPLKFQPLKRARRKKPHLKHAF